MLHSLRDGDEVIFLDNLDKNGEINDSLLYADMYWIQSDLGKTFIMDDPQMSLFHQLNNIYWLARQERKPIDSNMSKLTRTYSYALVNGEYKLIQFSKTIMEIIVELTKKCSIDENWTDFTFHVVIEYRNGFPSFEHSYFGKKHNKTITKEFLATKTLYFEDMVKSRYWTKEKNFKILMSVFKKYNINFNPIKEIKTRQRTDKLKRILDVKE